MPGTSNGLIDTATQDNKRPPCQNLYGVMVGVVVNNVDATGMSRVQVRFPWLPEIEPWARVAVLMSGPTHGTYFIPQIDDEVLVSFNQGDITDAYIIGSLWNGRDRPPTPIPTDAIFKRMIRTPAGHEIIFDDLTQSITISSSTKQEISIDPKQIKISTAGDTASVTLDQTGNITISAALNLTLEAGNSISIKGGTVEIDSVSETKVSSVAKCTVKAAKVFIN